MICTKVRRSITFTSSSVSFSRGRIIQLMELDDQYRVKVRICKIVLTRTITRCGMFSYASVVAGGHVQYVLEVGESMCREIHLTHIYRYSSNIVFHDIVPGQTQIRTATLSGSVDNECRCSGSHYRDAHKSWSNVVVT
uniref:Uncharacterized protein n=1 Tax=Syphacia muris TaxID=451379 RepID=A0A0N5B1M9_9BILA